MDIDDLGIWRRALRSEEVEAIFFAGYSSGKPLVQAFDPIVPPPVDPQPTALIANYELESDLADTSGNGLDATLTDGGGVTYGSTTSGTHLSLDNINPPAKSYATLPDSALLDFGSTTNFTVSFWQRTNVVVSDPSIVTNKNFGSGYNPGWTVGIGPNGRLEYNAGDGSSRCDYDGPRDTMTDGEWHHVVLTQTQGAGGQFELYLDGKKVTEQGCVLSTLSSGRLFCCETSNCSKNLSF